jgi:CDP-diacylglycerol--serine O-phosphatidyltransferase
MVTLLSLTLALISMHHSMRGDLVNASWFILYSVLLDKLDGTLARLLGAQSQMGLQLDSFADFAAFGLAPGFLLTASVVGPPGTLTEAGFARDALNFNFVHLLALAYIFGCVLRLARFNVVDSEAFDTLFRGVPSTHAGGLASSGVLVGIGYDPNIFYNQPEILGAGLAVLGVLMVSPLHLPKLGATSSTFWKLFTLVNVLGAYICISMRTFPEYILFIGVAYLIFGAFVGARQYATWLEETSEA